MDARPRSRLADPIRAALHPRHAAARRHRRHPDRAPSAGSAAVGFRDDHPRRVPRAKHSCRSRACARAAGVARARRSPHRRHVGDARRPTGRALSRRRAGRERARAPSTRSRSSTAQGSRSPMRRAACCRGRPARSCAFSPARAKSSERRSELSANRAAAAGIEIVPLHGSLDGDAQDAAISRRPTGGASSWRRTSRKRR